MHVRTFVRLCVVVALYIRTYVHMYIHTVRTYVYATCTGIPYVLCAVYGYTYTVLIMSICIHTYVCIGCSSVLCAGVVCCLYNYLCVPKILLCVCVHTDMYGCGLAFVCLLTLSTLCLGVGVALCACVAGYTVSVLC